MRTRIFVSCLLAASTTACVTPGERTGDEPECGQRTVSVINSPGRFIVRPNYIPVCRGDTVRFQLQPNPGANNARTAPETGGPTWLNASSTQAGEILLSVPADAPIFQTFKFTLTVDDIGLLDPYVRIIF